MTRIVTAFALALAAAAWLDPPWLTVAVIAVVLLWSTGAQRLQVPGLMLAAVAGVAVFNLRVDRYHQTVGQVSPELDLIGVVVGLPERAEDGAVRFDFLVSGSGQALAGARLRLTWPTPDHAPEAGDRWRLTARARRIRGLANPGQFDFETWAFGRGLHGTGYVTAGQPLGPARGARAALDRLRAALSDRLREDLSGPAARLLPALAVADRRYLEERDWAVFRATGTSHLLAISGLHIGLCAGVGYGLGLLLWRMAPGRLPRRSLALVPALALAVVYAALAGFSVATVRALIMFTVACAIWWRRGRAGLPAALAWAAAVVLAVVPERIVDVGFWLSYGAVAALLVGFHGRMQRKRWALLRAQLIVFVGLLPLTSAFGLGQSSTGPLVNLLAIPWIGWVVVPLLLAGCALLAVFPAAGNALVGLAGLAADALYTGLTAVAAALPPLALPGDRFGWLLVAAAILALPPGIPGRRLAPLVLAAGLWPAAAPRPPQGAVDLHVLDVGQGLAVVVRTRHHTLLYDAGPASRGGWSAGDRVVAPFLLARGWKRLDRVILSHGDSDHAGGWPALRPRIDAGEVLSSKPGLGDARCLAGDEWRWDGVSFSMLHPGRFLPYLGNDSSCVLLLRAGNRQVLLPGDIGAVIESRLTATVGELTLLVAAHHGSRSSSSPAFLAGTNPAWVVFAAGAHNRYAMPHPEVLARTAAARRLHSGFCGYLWLRIDGDGVSLRRFERAARRRPWHPPVQDAMAENQYDCALP